MKELEKGEIGKVIDVREKFISVSMIRNEACQKCGACTHGYKAEEMILEADNLCSAKIGDWVEIDLEYSDFLKATFIMYGIPLMSLFIGFFLGYYGSIYLGYENIQEPAGIVSGFIFMAISYLWIRLREKRWQSQNYRPAAVKIVKK
ncbi:MAG: SoxR reducing system RseC family protein [Epulopiscium sp.]|nr:SoxR reducing system RseC family protein [Candidatus Epulonipiscium sp.]